MKLYGQVGNSGGIRLFSGRCIRGCECLVHKPVSLSYLRKEKEDIRGSEIMVSSDWYLLWCNLIFLYKSYFGKLVGLSETVLPLSFLFFVWVFLRSTSFPRRLEKCFLIVLFKMIRAVTKGFSLEGFLFAASLPLQGPKRCQVGDRLLFRGGPGAHNLSVFLSSSIVINRNIIALKVTKMTAWFICLCRAFVQ